MANELSVSIAVALSRSNGDKAAFSASKKVTVTGTRKQIGTQQLSNVAEALEVGEVASGGYAWFQNLDQGKPLGQHCGQKEHLSGQYPRLRLCPREGLPGFHSQQGDYGKLQPEHC